MGGTAFGAPFFSVIILNLISNPGFAGGNNPGNRVDRGRFVFLLNNDNAVDHGWLSAMHGAVPERDGHAEDPQRFLARRDRQHGPGGLLTDWPGDAILLEKDDGRSDVEGEVPSPICFAALIGLPGVLGQRMRIRRCRKIGAGEFRDPLRRFSMSAREDSLKD